MKGRLFSALIILALAYVGFVTYVFDRDTSWVVPEVNDFRSYVLQDSLSFHPKSFLRIFDYHSFEFGPRSSRPLSSLVEIIDSKLRSALWGTGICPFPSLSVTLLFSLILTPLFLFRTLRREGFENGVIFLAIAVFLVSEGSLSTSVMHFRPAKVLANFSFVVLFDLARRGRALAFLATLFISCLIDESVAIMFIIAPILNPKMFSRGRSRLAYVSFPILLFFVVFYLLPIFSRSLGYSSAYFATYKPVTMIFLFKVKQFLVSLPINAYIFANEVFGPFAFWRIPGVIWKVLGLLKIGVVLHASIILLKVSREKQRKALVVVSILFVWHAFLMSLVNNTVWGPYWYGVYLSLALIPLTCEFFRSVKYFRLAMSYAGILILTQFNSFGYLNTAYMKFHHDPYDPNRIAEIFTGEKDRFAYHPFNPRHTHERIEKLWNHFRKTGSYDGCVISKDLVFVIIETARNRARFNWTWLVRDSEYPAYRIRDPGLQSAIEFIPEKGNQSDIIASQCPEPR